MKKPVKGAHSSARRKARTQKTLMTWAIGIAIVGLLGYGVTQMSNVAYDEDDITSVRFDDLDARQKKTALVAANTARCACGCGMTLAQCVATDMTCPVREPNIERIKTMVREARATPAS